MIKIILALTLLSMPFLYGQSFQLRGRIIDSETNKPIESANIGSELLSLHTTSDSLGNFIFPNILSDKIEIEITHVSYKKYVIAIDLKENKDHIFHLIPKAIDISPVVITSEHIHTRFEDIYSKTATVQGRKLERKLNETIASTLKNEVGLSIRSMGPAPARPVIRGLGSDRILLMEDGLKTVDLSSTSYDHAVTIDPFAIEKIEVLRGAKTILYTPATIGGVVNMVKHEILMDKHSEYYGILGGFYQTVNNGYAGLAQAEIPFNSFMLRADFNKKENDDLNTPIGNLSNSYSESLNYSGSVSYFPSFGVIGYSFRNFELDYGIPGGFIGAHPSGVDIEMRRQQNNLKSVIAFGSKTFNNLEIHASRVYYRHKEYESSSVIGAEWKILAYLGYLKLNHSKLFWFKSGAAGLSVEHRNVDIGGYVFNPPSKSLKTALFIYENIELDKWAFEFGMRYNYDNILPEYEKYAKIGFIRNREFNTWSLSFSGLYNLTEVCEVGLNISKSSRAPTIEELYSEGPHLAAYSYEIGNPELDDEAGVSAELFFSIQRNNISLNLSFFRYDIYNYIIPRNTGEINFQTFLPIYQTFGVDAVLQGFEHQIIYEINDYLRLSNLGSFVYGEFGDNSSPLPQIPPYKGMIELEYHTGKFSFGVNGEYALAQERLDNFEERTPGYFVINSSLQFSFDTDYLIHNFSLNLENILNQEYRNHLSRIKSILPEKGINLRMLYKVYISI